jgi:hypothetical protein
MKRSVLLVVLVLLTATGCNKSEDEGHGDVRYAQQITCVNNLKQIGLGLRIWQGDHGDKSPFELQIVEGGIMEKVMPKDGYRQNGYLIFQFMSNELTTPLIVICPKDKKKVVAKDWQSLTASNVSYLFPASSNVFAICPIDGNILYLDGTVEVSDGKRSQRR